MKLRGAQARPHGQQDRYNQKNRNVGLRGLKLSDMGFRRRIKCFCVEMNEVGHRVSTLKVVLSLEPWPFEKSAAGAELPQLGSGRKHRLLTSRFRHHATLFSINRDHVYDVIPEQA